MEAQLRKLLLWIRRVFRERLHYKNEDLPYYLTILVSFVLFVVAMNGFVDITEELVHDKLKEFDTRVTSWFLSRRTDTITAYLTFVTHLGARNGYLAIIILLALFFILRHRSRKFILQTVVVLALSTLSNIVLKEMFNRARPDIEHLVQVYTLSYPSGHAMSAMGFYGFLIFLVLRYRMNFLLKTIFVIILGFLILSIGISRIYLGVHFPSDVVAGFIGGLIWVTFCIVVFDVIELWRKRKQRIRELESLQSGKQILNQ